MSTPCLSNEPAPLDAHADLHTVLAAWHGATLRLEQTHEALQQEVRRLTDELAAKNRELARKNRLADLGQMASHVAHEVRNCLVPVTLYLSLLRRRLAEDAMSRELLDKLAAGYTALDVTVNDLLHFTAQRDPQRRWFEVRPLVDEVLLSLAPQLEAQGIRVALHVAPGQRIWADRDMLRRCILNLALNAIDAMPDGGELFFTSRDNPAGIDLEIADSGPGLSDEVRRRMFEPFFTTKSSGTGLGLAIVFRITEVHGGEVTAQNRPQRGAAFTLRIPHLATEAAA